MINKTLLEKRLDSVESDVRAAQIALQEALQKKAELDLVHILVTREIPQDAVVHVTRYDDEPESDGTFDVVLGEVDVNDEIIDDLSDNGGFAVGRLSAECEYEAYDLNRDMTLWDSFMDEDGDILASKVYEHAKTLV